MRTRALSVGSPIPPVTSSPPSFSSSPSSSTLSAFFRTTLDDPATLHAFKSFCARDFNIEAILFYESLHFFSRAVEAVGQMMRGGRGGGGGGGGGPDWMGELWELGLEDWLKMYERHAGNYQRGGGAGGGGGARISGSAGWGERGTVGSGGGGTSYYIVGDMKAAIVGQCVYIINTYVSANALLRVRHLRARTRQRIEERMADGRFRVDMFDEAMRETVKFLYLCVYPKFQESRYGRELARAGPDASAASKWQGGHNQKEPRYNAVGPSPRSPAYGYS
ncbi:hypothetical protein DFJ73DRAFT_830561 [Zopfochytrium polystomum]|nr:hypothetical protein DFJ73DRAFT_830561 [Zopfochytrium polystomum]